MTVDLDDQTTAIARGAAVERWPRVVVGVITYNSEAVIARTLNAILAHDYAPMTVQVFDNASTDGTVDLVRTGFPSVQVEVLSENRGPNPARNRIVAAAGDGLALILDDDCVPTPSMLRRLVTAAREHPEGGGFGARVVYDREPERIQFDGALTHFIGDAVQRNNNRLVSEVDDATRVVGSLGGGCQLIRGNYWRAVGGFDEDLFFGREDGEFSVRLAIAGYPSYIVPGAVVRHAFQPRGMRAAYYQIRNRWLVMLTLYRWRTLLLLAPALLLHELVILLFMAKQRSLGVYFRANLGVLRCMPSIRVKRRKIAAFRRVNDSAVLSTGPIAVRADLLPPGSWQVRLKNALDTFYDRYWQVVRRYV